MASLTHTLGSWVGTDPPSPWQLEALHGGLPVGQWGSTGLSEGKAALGLACWHVCRFPSVSSASPAQPPGEGMGLGPQWEGDQEHACCGVALPPQDPARQASELLLTRVFVIGC